MDASDEMPEQGSTEVAAAEARPLLDTGSAAEQAGEEPDRGRDGGGDDAATQSAPSPRTSPSRQIFPIVGIGASAGGLEALQAIMRNLRGDRIAFVIVQHLSPVHESLLAELLARSSSIPVTTLKDNDKVEPNHVYVIPANADITIRDGVLHLQQADRTVPRLPIDSFLRSLAEDLGPAAIGVILSGGGSDGTLGLKAIKAGGGITFAQDPGTATHPSMPQNALDSGSADFCLSPEEIAFELMRISSHPYVARAKPSRIIDQGRLSAIFSQLRSAFGVDFTQYKHSTLERRIERRMTVHKLEGIEQYVKLLGANPSELDTLYRDMLIGVTNFFRDRDMFEALKNVVFPRMLERRAADSPIRVWVAGCSTGEEAFSIAISLLEFLGDKAAVTKVQIFATDLDDEAIRQARHGIYRTNIELDVTPDRLRRFFVRKDDEYQIGRSIRDTVIFATQDLSKDPPFSRLDLVLCRNVLIYMQPPLQKKVLRIFHYALHPEGVLVLGTSESVGDSSDLFSMIDRKLKIYLKRNIPAAAIFDFAFGGPGAVIDEDKRVHEAKPLLSLQQLADRKVVDRYGPPGVVINDALEVLQFRGRTGPYLEPAPGAATLNVLKLARPELLMELRSAIYKALADNFLVTSAPVHVKADQGYRQVILEVMPLSDVTISVRCLLVLFREIAPPLVQKADADSAPEKDPRIIELERELGSTKNFLQTTIEELEAANEELKSANEELQSSNEELQSTNEELETSKEELQSTNEELATVNEELQNRMTELGQNNDDLHNLLAVVYNPIIIVGMDLRIRRFSQSAERQMNLIAGDVGRPVGHLRGALNATSIERAVGDVVNSVVASEQEIATTDGQRYLMRIAPYKTADHAIRGAAIEFVRMAAPAKSLGTTVEMP